MQRQVRSINTLDTFVILKGSELKREHLPASAGLPSSAGFYRSRSFGGDTLDGVAAEGKLLSDLLTKKPRSNNRKPLLNKKPQDTPIVVKRSKTPVKPVADSISSSVSSLSPQSLISSKKSSLDDQIDPLVAQRRARSLQSLAASEIGIKRAATAITLNYTLDRLSLYSSPSLQSKSSKSSLPPKNTNVNATTRKRVQSAKKITDAAMIKLRAIQDEKKRVAERSVFLQCRAQFIGMNRIVRDLEEAKWKVASDQSHTYEV